MTKQQEIDALHRFTESIPHDSYLRPWLADVLPQVEADIRNDFCVSTLSLTETRKRTDAMLAEAKTQAA